MSILTIKTTDDNWSYEDKYKSNVNTIGQLQIDINQFKFDTNQLSTVSPYHIQPLNTAQISTLSASTISSAPEPNRFNTLKILKYIISGNEIEYKDFIKRKGYSSDEYVYVYDAEVLLGKNNVHGYYVGSWKNREDIEEIKDAIRWCNLNV